MRNHFGTQALTVIFAAALLCMISATAHAIPILYRTNYTAALGPSGTGSFFFDNDAGVLSSFVWDFGGGIVGGTQDFAATDIAGDTIGRLVFELLSETDTHSGLDWINAGGFTTVAPLIGTAPFGAPNFAIGGTADVGSSLYRFGSIETFEIVAEGTIRISRAQVPEPTLLSLLAAGVFGSGFMRRRRAARSLSSLED